AEVAVEPFLGRLVVVGHHRQAQVGARLLGESLQLYRLAGGIRTGPGDHRNASGDLRDSSLDKFTVLVVVDSGRFSGSANDDDAVGAFLDVPIDKTAQRGEVQPAVLEHRRNNGYQ